MSLDDPEKPAPKARGRGRHRPVEKQENLSRLKAVARECFTARGFHEVTIREIATRAGVGIGTVFRHAENKHDLLALTIADDIEDVMNRMRAAPHADVSLLENLVHTLGPSFFFANPEEPALAQVILSELVFYSKGERAQRFRDNEVEICELIGRCLDYALETGEIRDIPDREASIWVVFAIHNGAVRDAASGKVRTLEAARARLARSLRVFVDGLLSGNQ